jgi:hypothetical protein
MKRKHADSLTPGEIANFSTLKVAVKNGDLALVRSTIKATGEKVALLCAMSQHTDGSVTMTPLGHLCPANPYEYYTDPSQGVEEL